MFSDIERIDFWEDKKEVEPKELIEIKPYGEGFLLLPPISAKIIDAYLQD